MKKKGGSSINTINCLICVLLALVVVSFVLLNPFDTHTAESPKISLRNREQPKPDAAGNNQATALITATVAQVDNSVAQTTIATKPITSAVNTVTTNTHKEKKTIAYAITITKDGPFLDGALVLGYAALKYHDPKHGYNSPYNAELIAFVVPGVVRARKILSDFGWKIIERKIPVALDEIENKQYANAMRDSGCCGADEFLKLWAYTLTEYYRVVHLDMDFIIFKPMDELYIIDKELLFTGDYNMKGGSPVPPVQGGFLVIKPNMERFAELCAIIRKGDHGSKGWGGSRIGNFWGGQTIQGILPYFYHVVHNGDAHELNRCVYNCMVDNPYHKNSVRCIDGQETCEDCRIQKPELVSSVHFTICQKPWTCTLHTNPKNKVLCEIFHKRWFEIRDEFETSLGIDKSYRAVKSRFAASLGMCRGYGDDKYLPIPITSVKH